MLSTNIQNFIRRNSLIQDGDRILVAYSGGPDSTCLLMILRELYPETGAVYVNHQLRGRESREEEKFVRDFCRKKKIPLFVEHMEWKKSPSDLEESARKRRYRHLSKVASEQGFQKVALAHHTDDVVETFLLRLIRGSGPKGLGRMKAKWNIYVRPMLESNRMEILDYLHKKRIPYFQDKSNKNLKFARNRIRKELIPYIMKNFNPGFPEAVTRSARWLEEQNELMTELLQPYAAMLRVKTNGWNLNRTAFLNLSPVLQKAVLRMGILQMDTNLYLSARSTQALVDAIQTGGSMELPGFLNMRCGPKLCLFSRKKIRTGLLEIDVPAAGEYKFPAGNYTLTFSRSDKRGTNSSNVAFLDATRASFPLYIRNWRTGDFFRPLGMKGTKKLSDYFIDKKIPRELRKRIPLVFKDDDLLWVAGHQIHHDYRITTETRKFLRIEVKPGA